MSARLRLIALLGVLLAALFALTPHAPPPHGPTAPELPPPDRAAIEKAPVAIAPYPWLVPDPPPGAARVFGVTRARVLATAHFSPDGSLAVAGDFENGKAAIRESGTGRIISRIDRGDGTYSAFRFTPDQAIVVAIGYCRQGATPHLWPVDIRRYEVATGRLLSRVELAKPSAYPFLNAAISRDGTRVFIATKTESPACYDTPTGKVVWMMQVEPGHCASAMTVSSDEAWVAVTLTSTSQWVNPRIWRIRILEASTGKAVSQIENCHPLAVFMPDGTALVALIRNERAIGFFNPRDGSLQREFPVWPAPPVAISPDGRWLVTGTPDSPNTSVNDGGNDVFELATGRHLFRVPDSQHDTTAVRFSPDSRTLFIPRGGFYEVPTGRALPELADIGRGFESVQFSHDGRTLTATGNQPRRVLTWEGETGREVTRSHGRDANYPSRGWSGGYPFIPRDRFMVIHSDYPNRSATIIDSDCRIVSVLHDLPDSDFPDCVSGDGRFLFALKDMETVNRYDVRTGKSLGVFADYSHLSRHNPENELLGKSFPFSFPSPCGRFVAISVFSEKARLTQIFDPASAKKLGEWTGANAGEPYRWSIDGNRVATLESREIEPLTTGTLTGYPEKQYTVSGIVLREPLTGRVISRSRIIDRIRLYGASPDLRSFVAASNQKYYTYPVIHLYESATGRLRHTFDPGEPWHGTAAFSPDGRFLATVHSEQPVILWDIRGERSLPSIPPDAAAMAKAWEALRQDDARAAFAAIRLLAAFPERSLPLLAAEVQHPTTDAARLARLVAALGAEEFEEREAAMAELEGLGRAAESALREAILTSTSPEVRERADRVLHRIKWGVAGEGLRSLRAVEVVEWIGTGEALALLVRWAAGPAESLLTIEAKAALARLRMK